MANFTGFTQEGLNFLQDAWINNSRVWFEEHRSIYDNDLIKPFRLLVTITAMFFRLYHVDNFSS